MQKHSANALDIATMLSAHPAVHRVTYPFLLDSPNYSLAARQMKRGGGMLSFEPVGGFDAAVQVRDRLRLIRRAVSLGDVESLISHPAGIAEAKKPIFQMSKRAWGCRTDCCVCRSGSKTARI